MTDGAARMRLGPVEHVWRQGALEKRLDFERIMVPFDMERLYEPKHPEVLRINPKRQVPVLIHGDVEIFDSTQIFEYLEDLQPEPALWPTRTAGPG